DSAQPFAEVGRIEMRVRVGRIEIGRPLVGGESLLGSSEILERDAEIEARRRVARARLESAPAMPLCVPRLPSLGKEPTEMDVPGGMAGVELERLLVRFRRLGR